MNCQETTEFFSDYYDGGLQAGERKLLEEHLRSCANCTGEYRFFTQSLQALHETRPMETTNVFMTNLKAAASQHIERRQNYPRTKSEAMTVVTPKADSKPVPKADRTDSRPVPKSRPLPAWVPWTLAATTLAAFGLGFFVSGQSENPTHELELLGLRERIAKLERRPVAAAPAVDEKKILRDNGLVETLDGQWIPIKMQRDFEQKKVCIGGEMVTREQAAKILAKEFPVEVPAPQTVTITPPSSDEILEKAGYTKFNDVAVPKAWVEKWAEGFVQVGVGEWRKLSDFEEELIREHNLVKLRGKLMTREQAEAIQAEQMVRPPANAVAANDFTQALDGLQIGPPMNFHGITIYPLLAAAAPPEAPFVTVHAALGTDKLEITDSLGLFQVQVRNGTDTDVLFLAGDVLTGGRCARMVSEHTMVPRGQTGKVPVLCVEPGVWKGSTDRFAKESGHFVAPPSMKRSMIWEQGQGAAWSLLAKRLGKSTGLVELYRKHSDAIAEFRAYFSALPDRELTAVGMAVAQGDSIEFVELFPDHGLFAAYFERLISGAALDLLERGEAGPRATTPFPNSMKGVKQLLESAFVSTYDTRDDGFTVRRDEATVGRVRLTDGSLQHAVLYAAGAPDWERKAAPTVPKDKMKKALDEYEVRLKAVGPARKAATIREMASIGTPEIVPVLIRHLAESDATVRRAVIQELGGSGDPRATEALVAQLPRSLQDSPGFVEMVRALAKLGHERAVDPLLKLMDTGEAEMALVILQGLSDVLLQAKSRDIIERATARIILLFESSEAVSKGDLTINDLVVKNMRPADAAAVMEAVRTSLKRLVGVEFTSSTSARKFWNDRDARERYLQIRTSK
jgi:hypothetical protein